jgi:DNA-directed RNA polymerase II subunit RPB2
MSNNSKIYKENMPKLADNKRDMTKLEDNKRDNISMIDLKNNIINQTKLSGDNNSLTTDDIFRVLDLYFSKNFYAYRHLHNSYDKFIEDTIPRFLTEIEHVFSEYINDDQYIKYKFIFDNVHIVPPKLSNNVDPLFPADARHLALTYSVKIHADITQVKEVQFINTSEKKTIITNVGHTEKNRPIMFVPVMVRSKYCNLSIYKTEARDECKYDPGGYFIINGSEKVVICQDRMIHNTPMVTSKTTSNITYKVVQVNSKNPNIKGTTQIISIRIKKDDIMIVKIPFLQEVNIMIIFRALGIESDRDIIELCAYDLNDYYMVKLISTSLNNCYNDLTDAKTPIRTQEDAIDYLISKLKVVKKVFDTNQQTRLEQKRLHLMNLFKQSLLPHITSRYDNNPYREKCFYIGYMINKLLNVQLGRKPVDNRDSYTNKRVDNIGDLLHEILLQQYNNIISECNKQFTARMGNDMTSDKPYNIIHQFKAASFEQGFKAALMLGNWPRKKGVSQMLQRMSYMYLMITLSRIESPSGSQSTSKLVTPRHVDPSSLPFLCVVQTPEGASIGLTKHLSLISSLTIGGSDNAEIIKDFIFSHVDVKKLHEVSINKIINMYKIFLNGEPLGFIHNIYDIGNIYTDNPAMDFYGEAKSRKLSGGFNPETTSIAFDYQNHEIRFWTDSGRTYRPVIRVNGDNEMMLTKSDINNISLNKTDINKYTCWEKFYMNSPYPIEFIDSEEQPYIMVAENTKVLNIERKKILDSKTTQFSGNEVELINRYDKKFFIRYDCVEFHPSVLLGELAGTIPFCNSNQGTRNFFQYAQGRQAMGIYCSTYRARTDISYILYNPENAVVNTRTAKYTYTDILTSGVNAVVAIACYSGYNQEDSLIFNKTALHRGMFRAMSIKKIEASVTKNQDTSGDDKFMKPPPEKTIGIKNGQYEKMNDDGYVREETHIVKGDMIFGKVTPISDLTGSDKIYRDSSTPYKDIADAVVDSVYIGIKNKDGYETRKALIRSERFPIIGDKFCSRHGQKGTIGITLEGIDMPFTKHGIRPDIIMSPNAIPSRMTIAQLLECLLGKVGALNGMNMDGTAFEDYDVESVKDDLEKLGYHREGTEYLYNGMTGAKMKHMIFIGPTYYQRLKHMVVDKLHSRARGPNTSLTRQPPEGRARDGGGRFGEMEQQAIVAHGMAKFLKERLIDCSDAYSTYVCGQCGLFARREESRYNKYRPQPTDVYYCPMCKNYNDIHKVMIPYAFKLMIQELLAMCIAPRIRIQKQIHE